MTPRPAPEHEGSLPQDDARTSDATESGHGPTESGHKTVCLDPVENPEMGTVIPLSAVDQSESAGSDTDRGGTAPQADGFVPRPARGYKWPDAEVGNSLALKHGVYSPRAIAERAALVHEHVLEVAPWLDEDRYAPSVQSYLQATAVAQLAFEAIRRSGEKVSPRLIEAHSGARRLAWSMGCELGLTPAGHAKLRMLVAGGEHAEASLADLIEQGRLTAAAKGST